MILRSPRERLRFLRFAVVGAIGAAVDFGTFNLMLGLVGLSPVLSSVVSFCAAVTSNFLGNRFWTYPESRSKSVARQLSQFALVNIAGLAIRTPLFAALEHPLQALFGRIDWPAPLTPEFLGHNLALAIAILVIMLWNFFVNRYWTYNDVE